MPPSLNRPLFTKLLTVASTSTTATSPTFSIPMADNYTFYLNVTTATAGTCDCVFKTGMDGSAQVAATTFINIPWRFAQIATTTGCFVLNVSSGVGGESYDTTAATGTATLIADTGGALNLQAVVDPANMQLKYTIATGPDAFTLYVGCWPRAGGVGSE